MDDEQYCHFPDPLIDQNKNWTGFWDFGMNGGGMGGLDNPWVNGTHITPFDQEVSLISTGALNKMEFSLSYSKLLCA